MDKKERERLQLLASAVEQISDGIALSDLNGYLLYVNFAFATTHGYQPEELVEKHLSVFHSEDQVAVVNDANRQLQEKGQFTGEIWHKRRDGSVFPTMMHNALLRDETGQPIGMIGTLSDITEQRRASAALRDITARKRAQEKLRRATEELQTKHKARLEKNIALTEILNHIEDQRQGYKQQICREIEQAILPAMQ